jgi:hypothetical protein
VGIITALILVNNLYAFAKGIAAASEQILTQLYFQLAIPVKLVAPGIAFA